MKKALMIVDHGSRRSEANEKLHDVARAVATRSGSAFETVEPAHMELAKPTIAEAFDRCVASGAQQVLIALFFLSPGRHTREDIPRLAAEAAARHPDVAWSLTAPIGDHEDISDIIRSMVDKTSEPPGDVHTQG